MPHEDTLLCSAWYGRASQAWPLAGLNLIGSFDILACQGVLAGIGTITFGTGRRPGVLLHVTRRCSRGVVHNVHLAVGLCISKMGGASVIQVIVIMGELSITLCSASRALR
jgi:hypothetical protein